MLPQMYPVYLPKLVSIFSWELTIPSIIIYQIIDVFLALERKDKIEEGNRILIQKFQSQLTQQLKALHKTVAASTMQQEQQLKDMEEDMQSFVSTKAEVRFEQDASVPFLATNKF